MGGKGSSSSTVTVNNGPITVDSDSTVDINGLNDIKVDATVHPLQLREELVFPDPIKTDSTITTHSDASSDSKNALSVDLKPIALDVCATTSTKLPHGEILQPFNVHFGLTWFGVEFFGFNFGGESRVVLRDLPRKPAVDWPAQTNTMNSARSVSSAASCEDAPDAGARGLRIRIK